MWYGDRFEFTFPDAWEIRVARMRGGPEIGEAGIRHAFAHPIGSPPLREMARGRRDAAILIDDLTRPTPAYRTLPYILEELAAAGLGDDQVKIVCALACHRAMTRGDFLKKVGLDLVQRLQIVNHNAHDNLEFYGLTSQGVPVWVNRDFAHADVKIAAGMITPRGPFFGGGCKLLLPGACGWQTIYADHSRVKPQVFRAHAAEVARMVGLEYIANPLLNEQLEIMAMITGDPEEAYWHGVEIGKELYRTEIPEQVDVVVCNAWPKDAEGTQSAMALVPLHGAFDRLLKNESTVVIATASPEGLGYHSLMGPGTQLRLQQLAAQEGKVHWAGILFSPNLHPVDARAMYGERIQFCQTWSEVRMILEEKHGAAARVCVFPAGAMQYTGA
jgi:nickel-dependent lactate racemase